MTDFILGPGKRFSMPPLPMPDPSLEILQSERKTFYNPELEDVVERYAKDFDGFVHNVFSWGMPRTFLATWGEPLEWQQRVLERASLVLQSDVDIYRLAVAAGRGVGKTCLSAWAYLWHMVTHPQGRTNALSITAAQLHSRLGYEIRKWFNVMKFKDEFELKATKIVHRHDPTWEGLLQTWNRESSDAVKGLHEDYLGIIVDEASAVPDMVLADIEAGLTGEHSFLMYVSNPNRSKGRFYECFTKRAHLWDCVHVNGEDVPIVSRRLIAEILEECGGDRNAYRYCVDVRGVFCDIGLNQVIDDSLIEAASQRVWNGELPRGVVIGVDVARLGDNKTVFIVRQGARILEVQSYAKQRIPDTARRLIDLIKKYERYVFPSCGSDITQDKEMMRTARAMGYSLDVFVDCDGIGGDVDDFCREEGYTITQVHSGGNAFRDMRFYNKRAEMWYSMKDWLDKHACLDSTAWYYTVLRDQLTDPYYDHDGEGRMVVETKKQMRARGVDSPDYADALAYTFFGLARPPTQVIPMRY